MLAQSQVEAVVQWDRVTAAARSELQFARHMAAVHAAALQLLEGEASKIHMQSRQAQQAFSQESREALGEPSWPASTQELLRCLDTGYDVKRRTDGVDTRPRTGI